MLALFLSGIGLWLGGMVFAVLIFFISLPLDIYLWNRKIYHLKKAKKNEFRFYFKAYLLMLKLICMGGGLSAVQKKYWEETFCCRAFPSLSRRKLKEIRSQVLACPLKKYTFGRLLCDLATEDCSQEQVHWLSDKIKYLVNLKKADNSESLLCFEQFKVLFNLEEEAKLKEKVYLLDVYGILECSQEASNEVIKRQFRRLSHLYHPDKLSLTLSSQEKKEAYGRFLNIVEAYIAVRKERNF